MCFNEICNGFRAHLSFKTKFNFNSEPSGKRHQEGIQNENIFVGSTGSTDDPDNESDVAVIPHEYVMARLFSFFSCVEEHLVNVNFSTTTSTVLEPVGRV